MIEELLVLTSEVESLKSQGKLNEAKELQAIIDQMKKGVPKGTKHGTD